MYLEVLDLFMPPSASLSSNLVNFDLIVFFLLLTKQGNKELEKIFSPYFLFSQE